MSDQRPTRDSMSLEEATVSNMWEIAARGGELVYLVCLVRWNERDKTDPRTK